jgi:hypothetical protein
VPLGHGKHELYEDPVRLEKEPAGHALHVELALAPKVVEKLPAIFLVRNLLLKKWQYKVT